MAYIDGNGIAYISCPCCGETTCTGHPEQEIEHLPGR